jgi:hypothetical protein
VQNISKERMLCLQDLRQVCHDVFNKRRTWLNSWNESKVGRNSEIMEIPRGLVTENLGRIFTKE